MKKIIFTLVGISFLFLSCDNELLEFQEETMQEGEAFSASLSSNSTTNCTPDIAGLEESLPNVVSATTTSKRGPDAYFTLDIDGNSNIAGSNYSAWCIDPFKDLDVEGPLNFTVYSSYNEIFKPGGDLENIFDKTENLSKVNYILNQGYVSQGYTYGHVQYAIWKLMDNNGCNICDNLTNPIGNWTPDDKTKGQEILAASDAGANFIPTCGEKIGIILIPEDGKQPLIITKEVPPVEVPCDECEGKVTELELQYTGDHTANIVVKTKKEGENGSKVVFEDYVAPGETFSFVGNDKKGTLGTEIKIYVDGNENTKIHTSCSKPIGPGLISGDFKVISGTSREGGNLCLVDAPPSGGDCDECEGKVTDLELQYNGNQPANIVVKTKKEGENGSKVVFEDYLASGETFSFVGNDKKGTLGTEIKIYVDGNENTKIHTSCSQPIGPGLISGDFEVISGTSREGGELCPVDTPPGGNDCDECEGKVTDLELQYNGNQSADIIVKTKKEGENGSKVVFEGNLAPGETFSFVGNDKKGTLGTEIKIYVDGDENTKIHTSCSKPIGPGLISGDFEVVSGTSREGGELCPVDVVTPPGGDDCNECDGKITRLDLQYNSNQSANIVVETKKEGIVFQENVGAGGTFTFFGNDKKGTLGTEITIYVNGQTNTKIHTSCSVPIGSGSVFGDFTVVGGASRNGGELCPVETPPTSTECDCDGKIVKMSVVYGGDSGATITVGDDEDGNNSKTYTNVQKGDVLTASLGEIGNWWYWSVNDNVEASIHTSCSDDILGNVDAEKSTFGDLGSFPDPEDVDGSRNNGTFLVISHTDNKGNTCSIAF